MIVFITGLALMLVGAIGTILGAGSFKPFLRTVILPTSIIAFTCGVFAIIVGVLLMVMQAHKII